MENKIEVLKASIDSYGGKEMPGKWCIELACGHNKVDTTRKDCKTYPNKKVFCGQCWANEIFSKKQHAGETK